MQNSYFLFLVIFMLVGCNPTTETKESPATEVAPIREETSPKLPNIVLMVADDHGKDALGCYGNPIIKTPHLDRLASEGTRFNRAFCTTASCSASRSVILTGMHNHSNGHYGHQHSFHHFSSFGRIKSLPVYLSQKGYRTARVGKYHLAPEEVYKFDQVLRASARSPIEMADVSTPLIQENSNRPFFLYFCFSDPHRGGGFAEELPYAPDRFGNRLEGYPGISPDIYDPDEVMVPPFLSNTPETRAEIAQYYQSISRLDQGVGKLIEILKSTDKYDNTLIIYISDNGMAFPGAKTTLYEAGMQLPCLVKAPGQKSGLVKEEMISWLDITPTILDYAEAFPDSNDFHGLSFRPVLENQNWERKFVTASHTFHEITMYYPMRVVRGERYKLILNIASGLEYPFASDLYASKTWQSVLKGRLESLGRKPINEFLYRPKFELYDIEEDPWETVNLSTDRNYAEILNGMLETMKDFQKQTGDPWFYKWEFE